MVELGYTHFENFEEWAVERKMELIAAIVNGGGWEFEGSQDFDLEPLMDDD